MKIRTFEDLLILKLKSLYDIETEIIKALPKVIKSIDNSELADVVKDHLDETKLQQDRLEQIFGMLDEKPQKTKVEGVRGIIKDTEWLMKQDMPLEILDASLIGVLSYVEQYEMAGYKTAISWARQLGNDDIADLLQETFDEEEAAAGALSNFAEDVVSQELIPENSAEE